MLFSSQNVVIGFVSDGSRVVQHSRYAMIFTVSADDQGFSGQARKDWGEPSGLSMGVMDMVHTLGKGQVQSTVPFAAELRCGPVLVTFYMFFLAEPQLP